jgi:hypothetical protein
VNDPKTVRLVAAGLVAAVLGGLLAAAVLAGMDRDTPALIGDTVKVSLGALAALLASTRTNAEPQPVQVQNTEAEPVNVAEVPQPGWQSPSVGVEAALPAAAKGLARKRTATPKPQGD